MVLSSKIGRILLGHDARRASLCSPIGRRRRFSVKELAWCAPKDSPTSRRPRRNPQPHPQPQPGVPSDGTARARAQEQARALAQAHPHSERAAEAAATRNHTPIGEFGIVAAMCAPSSGRKTTVGSGSVSGIIGVNGKLPWKYLPTDRKIFERLTRDRILIVGRRTLFDEQDGGLDHVRHAKHCIVVSNSISSLDGYGSGSGSGSGSGNGNGNADSGLAAEQAGERGSLEDHLQLARSLDEALDLARVLAEKGVGSKRVEVEGNAEDHPADATPETRGTGNNTDTDTDNSNNTNDTTPNDPSDIRSIVPPPSSNADSIPCWVAGGERLYEEALKHHSAAELHLSVVDLEIDLGAPSVREVARFPAKYRWDHNYREAASTALPRFSTPRGDGDEDGDGDDDATKGRTPEPGFVYHVYKRIVRNRS